MTRLYLPRPRLLVLAIPLAAAVVGLGGAGLAASAGSPAVQGAPPAAATPTPIAESGAYAPSFTVGGMVGSPTTYDLVALQALPSETITASYDAGHGVETHRFQGVRLYDLLMRASPQFAADVKNDPINWYANVSAIDGYQGLIAWGEIDPQNEDKDVIVAYSQDGQLLGQGYGMAELIVPGDITNGRYVASITSITVAPAGG